jgi:hypothetical protein
MNSTHATFVARKKSVVKILYSMPSSRKMLFSSKTRASLQEIFYLFIDDKTFFRFTLHCSSFKIEKQKTARKKSQLLPIFIDHTPIPATTVL